MKVLFVSSLWPPTVLGGAELYAARLAERLEADGDETRVVTLGVDAMGVEAVSPAWPYPLADFAGQPAWKRAAYHARDQFDPWSARAVTRAIESFQPDVVHSHAVPGMSAAALTAPGRAGIAHVHTLHDYWLLCQRSTLVDRDDRSCATRCRGCSIISAARSTLINRHPPEVVLAVSEAVAAEHRRAGVLADRIRVVRNPVERADRQSTSSSADGDVVTFGFLGQLVPIKGVSTLLAAFAALPAGSARLRVAGKGPLLPAVEAAEGVEAVGWVDGATKEEFLGGLDCLVVPSEWRDPAPLVLNEARSRGLPVIGARIGGIPELLAPASESLLFPSGDASALAARMTAFAADPASFRPADEPPDPWGWPEHVAAVRAAYDDARRAASGTRS